MDKKMFSNTNTGSRSPGPAAYSVKTTIGILATDPSIEKNPAYSILGSRKTRNAGFDSPGPMYNTSQLNRTGKYRTTGGILSGLLPNENKKITPSPTDYHIGTTLVTGGTRMRPDVGRTRDKNQDQGPAPNAYCIPDSLDGRAARLSERFPIPAQSPTPGPGQYIIPHGDLYLHGRYRGGRSMGKKFSKSSGIPSPGPSDYNGCPTGPSHCKRVNNNDACRSTFGMRRPDSEPVFAVLADNDYDCY